MSDQASESKSYEELLEARKDLLKREWRTFQRELARLLAEGHKGRIALVKDDDIVGVYPDVDAALAAGYAKFGLTSFMVQPIVPREEMPVYRTRWASTWQS